MEQPAREIYSHYEKPNCRLCVLVHCAVGELAAFLVELVVQKKLVVPNDTGDSSPGSLLYDFLHGEEAM